MFNIHVCVCIDLFEKSAFWTECVGDTGWGEWYKHCQIWRTGAWK